MNPILCECGHGEEAHLYLTKAGRCRGRNCGCVFWRPVERVTVEDPERTISIDNDGPELVSTNFWGTKYAEAGLYFLSTNAHAFRLLVPPNQEHHIPEMLSGVHEVILTRGMYVGRDSIEVMFEDHSETPFCIHLETKMADRVWPPSDDGHQVMFMIYTAKGKVGEFSRCFLRRTDEPLPYAAPYNRKVN
jgi:hypothetical protein